MPDVVRANGVSEHGNFYVFTVRKLQFLAVFCRQMWRAVGINANKNLSVPTVSADSRHWHRRYK